MAQGPLPFEYQPEENSTGLTSFAGLPVFLDLMVVIGFAALIRKRLNVRPSQGWTDTQQIVSMIALHLVGGESIEDLEQIEADEGLCHILEEVEGHGLRARQRRALEKRWRTEKTRSVPSPDSTLNYLKEFDTPKESVRVQAGTAYVPAPNEHLQGLSELVGDICAYAQLQNPQIQATLDMDATLIESNKASAMFTYKKFKGYQPLNVFWYEQGLMLHSEFRPGNAPAAWRNLDVLRDALDKLPHGVNAVRVRTDTAGYGQEELKYMAEGHNERFGVIEFAVGVDVTPAFKQAVSEAEEKDCKPLYVDIGDGQRIETNQEYAEVCFVPNWVGHSKAGPEYRFIAIRQAIDNELPGLEQEQKTLPFPTWSSTGGQRYKLFGVITNIDREEMDGNEVIHWHRQRCGDSEHVHSVLKTDLGAGRMPCDEFGANAAWWQIALLACNFHVLMQRLIFGRKGLGQRLKTVRFQWLNVAGRVISHARKTIIRIAERHPALAIIRRARNKLLKMSTGPPGRWLAPS